jgi:hypothetical protein
MKEFTRQPTRAERAVALILNAALAIAFCFLAAFLLYRGAAFGAVVCGVIAGLSIGMFVRAAFGARRALDPHRAYWLAWVLLLAGIVGFIAAAFSSGSLAHRLMLLGASITCFSAGSAGVRRRK